MDIALDEVLHFDAVTHHPSTAAVTDADSTPTWSIFEEDTDTAILSAQNFTKRTSLTGNYRGSATLSTANGFEVGKWYNVIGSATVNSIAGKAVVMRFRVCAAEAVAGVPNVNTTHAAGTAWGSGAITAASIAADAITDAKVASDVTIASVTGAVGSVTGNVGGNVTGSVGSVASGGITSASFAAGSITSTVIASNAIDADALAADAVTEIQNGLATAANLATLTTYVDTEITDIQSRLPAALVSGRMDSSVGAVATNAITPTGFSASTGLRPLNYGTLQSASGGYNCVLESGASSLDNAYVRCWFVTTGGTAANQCAMIEQYNGTTKGVTLHQAIVPQPDNTTTYVIIPAASVYDVHQTVSADVVSFQANTITDTALATSAVTEIQSGLATASALSTVAGYIDTEVAAIKAKTDNLPASPAATGDIPTVSQIWTTALTEAYRSTGSTGTAAQLLYEILQNITEFAISSTTKTVKKLDGSTTAKTYTLDSSTAPTSITETT